MTAVLAKKKSLAVIIILIMILIGSSISILFVSEASKPDLNSDVEIIKEEYLSVWNESNRVLWRSGVINATSDVPENIGFWINVSQFEDLRLVRFLYSNGTHGEYYNSSEPLGPKYSWNYLQWWTDFSIFVPDNFNTTNPGYFMGFSIPKQLGKTIVTFQLSLGLWNGTGLEFQEYNSTYSVRYSDYEVWFDQEVHMTTGTYYALSCILLAFVICIITFLSFKETDDVQPQPLQNPYAPDIPFYVGRTNHLDRTKNNLRTGASILLTLGASSTVWMGNVSQPWQSFLVLGFLSLSLCAFFAIILTFASTKVESSGFELESSLIPSGQTPSLYLKQLKEMIKEKQKIIGRVESLIGIGLLYLIAVALSGILFGMLPNAWAIIQDPITMTPFWVVFGLISLNAILLSYVVFGPKGMGLFSFSDD